MAETDTHCDDAVYVIETLKAHYADRPDAYISGNNFIFYAEIERLRAELERLRKPHEE